MGTVLIILGIIGALAFIYPMLSGIVNLGSGAGLALSLFLIIYGIFRPRCSGGVRLAVRIVLLAGLALVLAEGFILFREARRIPQKEGTLVILGCTVHGDYPSLVLRTRIDAAAAWLKDHPGAKAVCTGGKGKDETISEGGCICRELIKRGIEASRLYVEDKSVSTSENLIGASRIIKEERLESHLIIVSSDYHLYRACHMARRMGFSAESLAAGTPLRLLSPYFLRECAAVLKEWILPDPLPRN